MTDRRKQVFSFQRHQDRRTRLMDRRQHVGPFRFLFIPVADFFRRIILGSL
jgi:hypothetical protein